MGKSIDSFGQSLSPQNSSIANRKRYTFSRAELPLGWAKADSPLLIGRTWITAGLPTIRPEQLQENIR